MGSTLYIEPSWYLNVEISEMRISLGEKIHHGYLICLGSEQPSVSAA